MHIVWFRQDLRLRDNPAWQAAIADGEPVLAIYILDDASPGQWKIGSAARWWLHHSLIELKESLQALGGDLILRRGDPLEIFSEIISQISPKGLFWNRCYEPHARRQEAALKELLTQKGTPTFISNSTLLFEPEEICNKQGRPYRVFTQFWKACLNFGSLQPPLLKTGHALFAKQTLATERLQDWHLQPQHPNWAKDFSSLWQPGEKGAWGRLRRFLEDGLEGYETARDLPDQPGTSGLSPHLHFGEISTREIWKEVLARAGSDASYDSGKERYLAELGWREFSYHLLYHFPSLPAEPFVEKFRNFPWSQQQQPLKAWQHGLTGYPIVDAGMRQLWEVGWMHNRVRMITASFLTKDLLIPWQAGAEWFWNTLVDADLASNSASWQWVAGCGADAAPYFRIFNPILQGQKFDRHGHYIRRWVPELGKLPTRYIHSPWEAPAEVLSNSGITLGATYPYPIVDHSKARDIALAAFHELKMAKQDSL